MDQKHAMLYPPIDQTQNTMQRDQRISASAAMGLPTEAPPSYDMAMASGPGPAPSTSTAGCWVASAPEPTSPDIIVQQPQMPMPQPMLPQTYPPRPPPPSGIGRTVIVEQPQAHHQLPTVPLPTDATSALPIKLGPNPCAVTCPACGTCKTTRMCYTPNPRTHLCALLLCLVGWCCCACCVPYCMNSCRTGNHYCAKCNTFLGTFNPRQRK